LSPSLLAVLLDNPAIDHVINTIKAFDHSFIVCDRDNGRVVTPLIRTYQKQRFAEQRRKNLRRMMEDSASTLTLLLSALANRSIVEPLRHVPSHNDIQNLFTVAYRPIDDLGIVRMGNALFNGAVHGSYDFQQMFIELFCIEC
jgi:hypothetical protein